jgi:hypothetical protein
MQARVSRPRSGWSPYARAADTPQAACTRLAELSVSHHAATDWVDSCPGRWVDELASRPYLIVLLTMVDITLDWPVAS